MQHKHILAALAVVSLAACAPAAPVDDDGSSSSAVTEASSSAAAMETSSSASAAGDARVVDVTVTDWTFSPATITAKQGESVSMRLVGDKGIHSLLVADLGVNVRVEPGQSPLVAIPTDKTGTFEGRCGVPCGPGHRDMTFTIVVE